MSTEANSPDAEQKRRDRVVIAAAVAAVFGRRASIRAIRPVPGHAEGEWMREGRLAVQTSHRMPAPLAGMTPGPERSKV
jgi:hypothetical protein